MANDCPSRSSTSVSARRVMSAGTRKPSSVMPLLKSSALTSGRTFRRMTSPAIVGLKFSFTPNSLNMIVTAARIALHDRHRKLAAGEKARLLAVVGDQVRLGERLEQALLLERLDDRAEAFLAVEEEEVQEIAEDEPPSFSSSKSGAENCCVVIRPVASGRVEKRLTPSSLMALRLTSATRTCSITCWLSEPPGSCSMLTTPVLARHPVGDLAGAQHDGVARHAAREDDALVVHRHPDVLAREELLKRLLKRRHAGIDHDVVLAALLCAPHDQADRSGALAVDQHLARLDDDRIGDRRVRHRDARDVERRAEHRRAAGRQDDPLEAAAVGRLRGGRGRQPAEPSCAAIGEPRRQTRTEPAARR